MAARSPIEVQPTQVYGCDDLVSMAGHLTASERLPEGFDVDAALEELDGAVMSVFVRGRKPQ